MTNIKPSDASQIAYRLEHTFKDVAFYNNELVFCDLIERLRRSDWKEFDHVKNRIDAEIYVYSIVPEIGGIFEIKERLVTPNKKGSYYRVLDVIDRSKEGFGFVCALEGV